MRRLLVVLFVLCACTTPNPPPEPVPGASAEPTAAAAPTQLPAAEPEVPTLAEFRREAARACALASAAIAAAEVPKDPFREDARRRDVRAAIHHYRTAAEEWTAAASELFDFGLPNKRVGERFITSLDTVAQYSHQAAQLLEDRDYATAELAIGAVDTATVETNKVAARLGIGRIEDCARAPGRLPGAQRVRVTATDFSFSFNPPASGPTRFVLRNRGEEPHQLFVVQLREAGTLDDAVRADRFDRRPGQFLRGEGATSPVVSPGKTATLDVRLPSGAYGLLCFVASEDGTPHAYKGMATEFQVP